MPVFSVLSVLTNQLESCLKHANSWALPPDSVGLRSRNLQVLTINPGDSMQVGYGPHLKKHVATSLSIDLKNKRHTFLPGEETWF